jgi:hypothetical protein
VQGIPQAAVIGKKIRKRLRRWKIKLFPGLGGMESPELTERAQAQEAKAFERHVKETNRRYEDEEIALLAMIEGDEEGDA